MERQEFPRGSAQFLLAPGAAAAETSVGGQSARSYFTRVWWGRRVSASGDFRMHFAKGRPQGPCAAAIFVTCDFQCSGEFLKLAACNSHWDTTILCARLPQAINPSPFLRSQTSPVGSLPLTASAAIG